MYRLLAIVSLRPTRSGRFIYPCLVVDSVYLSWFRHVLLAVLRRRCSTVLGYLTSNAATAFWIHESLWELIL